MTSEHSMNFPLMATADVTAVFPSVIDSTIVAAFTACPLKAYREYFLRLGSPTPSIHLHAGGAVARAIEVTRRCRWEEELSFEDSLERAFVAFTEFWGDVETPDFGTGANKTFERCWQAVEYYFEQYPIDTDPIRPYIFPDGKTGIEFTFSIPLPITNPDTGDPIIYAGRADLLGYYRDASAIIDEKTTTSLGATWPDQWKLRGQFFGYIWAARQSGIHATTGLVRGIAILKTKFNHMQVPLIYKDFMIDRWYQSMITKVNHMTELYKYTKEHPEVPPETIWTMSFGSACSEYSGCMFRDLCTSPKPTRWYSDYAIRQWNPLEKNPAEVEHVEVAHEGA